MFISGITNICLDEEGTLVWFGEELTDESRKYMDGSVKNLYIDRDEATGEELY